MSTSVTEAELQAWVDGRLAPERRAAIDAYLGLHPSEAERLQAYRRQNVALRALFNPILDQPLPDALAAQPRPAALALRGWRNWLGVSSTPAANDGRPLLRAAAMLALSLAGGAAGWLARDAAAPPQLASSQRSGAEPRELAHRAALAHAVYTPEKRHPVEVGADQEQHLVAWLSKRLGTQLRPPQLGQLGYQLEGGRLLPGASGPVAQFMYHDAGGARLTLYVSTEQTQNQETGFRFAQEGQLGVFYWIDGKFGYALSGSLDKAALGKLADTVYAQLDQPEGAPAAPARR